MSVTLLDFDQPKFPAITEAADYPNGLLAAGGNLAPETLLDAYRRGIFPWNDPESPILWWSPDPREVVLPDTQHWSRSMCKIAQQGDLEISSDKAFKEVIKACARLDQKSHWITQKMQNAYLELHRLGYAHSVEIWESKILVGGLYGVAVGAAFCGESMFHKVSNSSKLAFLVLADTLFAEGFKVIDCQFATDHLRSLGSREISRNDYHQILQKVAHVQIPWPAVFGKR